MLAPHPLAAVRQLAGFFLRVIPWRSRKRQSELRLVRIRRLRSSATVSTKVRSGCWAIRSSICSANSSVEKRFLHAASAQRSCFRASAAATLPPNSHSPRNVQLSRAATHRLQQLRLRVPADHQNRTSASPAPATENQCTKIRSSLTLWESRRFKSDGNRFRVRLTIGAREINRWRRLSLSGPASRRLIHPSIRHGSLSTGPRSRQPVQVRTYS